MLESESGHLEARLTDFGLVKPENAMPMTRTGVRLGTPLYMAPETRAAKRGDARVSSRAPTSAAPVAPPAPSASPAKPSPSPVMPLW